MTKSDNPVHPTTIYVPISIWNSIRLSAIRSGTKYNDVIVKALKEAYGEINDLTKVEVIPDAS